MKWPGHTIWDTRIQGVMGILCARDDHGVEIYASATFAQATADPPRVVVNPNRMYQIEHAIRSRGTLSVNIMPSDCGALVAKLMRMRRRQPHKATILGIEVEDDEWQIPYITSAMRVLFCEVEQWVDTGDRRLYVTRVLGARSNPELAEHKPLLFSRMQDDERPVLRGLRWLATRTGIHELIKRAVRQVRPQPPADIQTTTYEMAGSTEEELARIDSYGRIDLSRSLKVPKPAADVGRPLNVCVVGTRWGFEHCRWVREAQPNARLFVCGRDRQRTAKVARAVRAVDHFVGLEQALADPRVEAVSMALPHDVHRPATEAALAAGKHTLIEKPIATTLADADAMIAAAEDARTTLMVAEDMHFRPSVLEAVKRIDAGDIGEPLYMLVHAGGIMRPSGWKQDKLKMGGGVLIDIGVHYIRAMRLLMGEPDAVFASRAMQINTRLAGEDSVHLMFSCRSGWEAHMLLSWASYRGTLPDIVVAGDAGTLATWPQKTYLEYFPVATTPIMQCLSYVRPYWLQNKLMRPQWQRKRIRWKSQWSSGYVGQMREFLACVAESRAPQTTAADARRDLEIVLHGYASLEEGRQTLITPSGDIASRSTGHNRPHGNPMIP